MWTWHLYDYKAWCAGNGPATYAAVVRRTDGIIYVGETRWYCDRRGSRASCGLLGVVDRWTHHTL